MSSRVLMHSKSAAYNLFKMCSIEAVFRAYIKLVFLWKYDIFYRSLPRRFVFGVRMITSDNLHTMLCLHNIGFHMVSSDPFISHLATQLGYSTGEFQVFQRLSLWCLVSWINHFSPVCRSTFWKSTFKQQLGCRFDIMDCKSSFFNLTYAIVYVLTHHMIFRLYLNILLLYYHFP